MKKSKECFMSCPLSVRNHVVSGFVKFPPSDYSLIHDFDLTAQYRWRHCSSSHALLYLAPACSLSASVGWRGPWGSSASAARWWSGPWWCQRAAARGQSSGCPSEGLQRQSKANSDLTIEPKTEKENTVPPISEKYNHRKQQPNGPYQAPKLRRKSALDKGIYFTFCRGEAPFCQLLLGGKNRQKRQQDRQALPSCMAKTAG